MADALAILGASIDAHDDRQVTLCEALDRVLHKGAVVRGEITISVADVDLVYLGFHVLLASVETARNYVQATEVPRGNV